MKFITLITVDFRTTITYHVIWENHPKRKESDHITSTGLCWWYVKYLHIALNWCVIYHPSRKRSKLNDYIFCPHYILKNMKKKKNEHDQSFSHGNITFLFIFCNNFFLTIINCSWKDFHFSFLQGRNYSYLKLKDQKIIYFYH